MFDSTLHSFILIVLATTTTTTSPPAALYLTAHLDERVAGRRGHTAHVVLVAGHANVAILAPPSWKKRCDLNKIANHSL